MVVEAKNFLRLLIGIFLELYEQGILATFVILINSEKWQSG